MKSAFSLGIKAVFAAAVCALALVAGALRGEETNLFGAHMQQPEIVVAPESNGVMALTCKIGFIGGCCFPLTSHDVTATLAVTDGIAILSGPEPEKYAAIEAPPSGTPKAWAIFHWRIQQTKASAGSELTVTVSSPGSGQIKATHMLDPQNRIRVSGPKLPDVLPVGKEIPIAVDATSLDQDRFLKTVRLWYSTEIPDGAEKVDVPPGLAARGIMRFSVCGRQLMVQGQAIDLARKYEPTIWNGVMPAQTQGPLYGFAVATDDKGATAHGPVVRVTAPALASTMKTGGMGLCPIIGLILVFFLIPANVLLPRRVAVATDVVVLVVAIVVILWSAKSPAEKKTEVPGYPEDSSAVVYLFLDHGDASRKLAETMETYRRAAPHRIHVLCFVDGITPAPVMKAYREQLHVTQIPSAVFDAHLLVDGGNITAINGTLDQCMSKPSPRLSMELLGGVIAGNQLSLGFIMCNHASRHDVHGSVSAFAFENGVTVEGWTCDHVVRHLMIENRPYAIPMGKCQPPAMMKWDVPPGVVPAHTGALTVILDGQGNLIDSICTERSCSRTGVCG